MGELWVMVRAHMNWLEVDFVNFVDARDVPVKTKSSRKMEVIWEDGVRLLGFTASQVEHGSLRGMNIAKRI